MSRWSAKEFAIIFSRGGGSQGWIIVVLKLIKNHAPRLPMSLSLPLAHPLLLTDRDLQHLHRQSFSQSIPVHISPRDIITCSATLIGLSFAHSPPRPTERWFTGSIISLVVHLWSATAHPSNANATAYFRCELQTPFLPHLLTKFDQIVPTSPKSSSTWLVLRVT